MAGRAPRETLARKALLQSSDVNPLLDKLQPYPFEKLKKLFAGIFSVKFSEGDASIIAMCSLEGEVVPLAEPVPVSDTVEVWLALLNTQMRATLVQLVANTIGSRLNIAATPSQVRAILRRAIISAQFSAQFSGAIR